MLVGPSASAADKIDLRVLYAGNPGSDRKEDFVAFLKQYFAHVGTIDFRRFKPGEATAYDVIIFDWTSITERPADGELARGGSVTIPVSQVTADFDRPAILVGAAGGEIASRLRLKIDPLCLCLQDAAHGIVDSHEIFRRPYPVDLRLEELATPALYRDWPGGEKLGTTIKVWRVQRARFPTVNFGPVSDPFGFDDSPDAEAISGGLNSKGPDSIALGRQGNFFLWGFSASPSLMTPEARKCFVNAVCYIKKYQGQRPMVHRVAQGREWALYYAGLLKHVPIDNSLMRVFPEDLRRRFGTDSEKYLAYYRENLEYLHPSSSILVVDEDVKNLCLSNRKVEILDRCVRMLEEGDRSELALRILRRYTTENLQDASAWRAWLEEGRGRLFFTDVGGYKFLVAPASIPVKSRLPVGHGGKGSGGEGSRRETP
jgi:hypothetical protein